ncbi:MAG: glycosyltransferase [Clostridia bacterium]|nr:glycosyltransferase [Clostridia bacterium]
MLSLVVPAYNEGDKIYNNLMTICSELDRFCDDYEVLPINDGSKDNTHDEINRAAIDNTHIRPISYTPNRGKGGAIVEGVREAKGDLIGFIDADLDLAPSHFEDFLNTMKNTSCDIVIGSKMHEESKLEYPFIRKVYSIGYYVMLKILFGLKIKDTQTGIKLYRSDLIKEIAPKLKTQGFAFDIEILALASTKKAKIEERPITLEFTRGNSFGRIHIKDILKMFTDTIKIWWNLKIRRSY